MQTLEASSVNPSDLEILNDAVDRMSPDSHLAAVLTTVKASVCDGVDIVLTADREVTPSQAAALLRMSRPVVYKLMDEGALPFTQVGRDRRIGLQDLADFQARREAVKARLAATFAHTDRDRSELVRELSDARKAARRRRS